MSSPPRAIYPYSGVDFFETRPNRKREIPIAGTARIPDGAKPYQQWKHRLRQLLDEMHDLYETHRPEVLKTRTRQKWDSGQIFPWNPNASQPGQALKRAKSELGWAPDDGRTVHTFRATGEHLLMQDLRLPQRVVFQIVGHSPTTYGKHYKKSLEIAEMEELIEGAD